MKCKPLVQYVSDKKSGGERAITRTSWTEEGESRKDRTIVPLNKGSVLSRYNAENES